MCKSTFGQLIILFTLILPVMASVKTRLVEIPTSIGTFRAEIHYREWERDFADHIQEVLLKDSPALLEYFRYIPRGVVQFSTQETPSQANGMAWALYGNRIFLNNHPPVGASHLTLGGDWIQLLVIHELTHIIHMDQTRGFPETIRSIFGSYGKWGGVAPTWFLEGIAVWAETKFSTAGRLRNKKMRYEFDATLFRKGFCDSLGCLDNPGVYPYRSYPYWAGAFFLEYLEGAFPGSIRCLVQQNSYNFPGFLNEAFRDCFQLSAWQLYEIFKKSRRMEIEELPKEPSSLEVYRYQKDGEVDWQKGFAFNKNRLFFMERDQAREHFVEADLDSGFKQSFDFGYLVEHIPLLSAYSLEREQVPLVLYNVEIADAMRLGKIWGAREQHFLKEVDLKDRRAAHYLFQLESDKELVLRSELGRWKIEINGQQVASLGSLESLTSPQMIIMGGKEILMVRSFSDRYRLLIHSLKEKDSWREIYSSLKPFECFGQLGGGILIKKDKLELLSLGHNKVTIRTFNPSWGKELVELRANKGRVVALFEGAPGEILKGRSGKLIEELKRSESGKRTYSVKSYVSQRKKRIAVKEESYPSLRHFVPAGWYMGGVSGTSGYYGAFTDFHDPRRHHNFSLNGKYYYNYSKAAGGGRYTYNFRGRDRFFLSGVYESSYSWNSYVGRARKGEAIQGQIRMVLPFGRWTDTLSLSATQTDFDNFVSIIKIEQYSIAKKIGYSSLFSNSFFNSFSVTGYGHQFEPRGYEKYFGMEFQGEMKFKFHRRLGLNLSGVWGKLFKRDAIFPEDGFLEGGERGGALYDVYGMDFGNLYGNYMTRVRAQWEYNLWEIFGGVGTLPIFIQNIDFFTGVDHFKAHWFVFNNNFVGDKIFTSAHMGLRISSVIGYYLPFTLEGTVSRITSRGHQWRGAVQFNLGVYL